MPSRLPSAESLQVAGIRPSIQPVNIPTNPIPGALQNLGQAVQGFGERRDSENQTSGGVDKSAAFQAQADFIKFQSDWDTYSDQAVREAPLGAEGLSSKLGETYKNVAGGFISKIDPKLQPEYTVKLLQKQAQERERAIKFEIDERNRNNNAKLDDGLKILGNNIAGSKDLPDLERRSNENIKAGDDFIKTAPDAVPVLTEKRLRAWHATLPKLQAESLNTLDPYAAQKMYRGNGVPSGAEQAGIRYLMGKGLTKVQAAAVAARAGVESSHNPNAVNPGDGSDGSSSVGTFQWNGDRAIALRRYAASRGVTPNDAQVQYDFLLAEMFGDPGHYGPPTEGAAGAKLRAADTPEKAAEAMLDFERPEGWSAANPRSAKDWQTTLVNTQRLSGSQAGGPSEAFGPVPRGNFQTSINFSGADTHLSQGARDIVDGITESGVIPVLKLVDEKSGFRNDITNKAAGGADQSQHLHGNAIDIDLKGLTDQQKADVLRVAIAHGARGIGVYAGGDVLHVDSRATPTLWGAHGYGKNSIDQALLWAQPALREMFAQGGGPAPTPSALDAQGNPQTQNPYHPLIDGLSPMDRLAYAADADSRVQKAETAVKVQDQQRYDTWKNDFQTGIIDGKVGMADVQAARSAGILTDAGDIASFMNAIEQRDKDVIKSQAAVEFVTTPGPGNAFDTDDKKQVKLGYETMGGSAGLLEGNPASIQRLQTVVGNRGIIPEQAWATIQNGASSPNPETLSRTMMITGSIMGANNKAFAAYEGGSGIAGDTAAFNHLVRDLGKSPLDAAKEMIDARDPIKVKADTYLDKRVDDFLKDLKPGDVVKELNLDQTATAKLPGYSPIAEDQMMGEFKERARYWYREMNGNEAIAKQKAAEELRHTYGVTTTGGDAAWMKYPPEARYPTIGKTHDYINREMIKDAASDLALHGGPQPTAVDKAWYAANPNKPETKRFYERGGIEDVYVTFAPETALDFREGSGNPPRYNLWYTHKVNGQLRLEKAPDLFSVQPGEMKAYQLEQEANDRAKIQEDQRRQDMRTQNKTDEQKFLEGRTRLQGNISGRPAGPSLDLKGGAPVGPDPNFDQSVNPASPPPAEDRQSYIGGGRPAYGSTASPPPAAAPPLPRGKLSLPGNPMAGPASNRATPDVGLPRDERGSNRYNPTNTPPITGGAADNFEPDVMLPEVVVRGTRRRGRGMPLLPPSPPPPPPPPPSGRSGGEGVMNIIRRSRRKKDKNE